MVTSSRTPGGWPSECPICGHTVSITPSPKTLDAPCPHCGHLLWFTEAGLLAVWNSSLGAEQSKQEGITDSLPIAAHVLESIPESVVRENIVIPIAECANALLIAATAPVQAALIEKLQFILNRRVLAAPTTRNWVTTQIDKHYRATRERDTA
jgi:hypothetical protein